MFEFPKIDLGAVREAGEKAMHDAQSTAQKAVEQGAEAARSTYETVSSITAQDVVAGAADMASKAQDAATGAYEAVSNLTADDVKNAAVAVGSGAQELALNAATGVVDTAAFIQEQGVAGLVAEGQRRGVFNRKLKEAAMEGLESATGDYEQQILRLSETCEALYAQKQEAIGTLRAAGAYVSSIANKPKEFDETMSEVEYEIVQFSNLVLEMEKLDRDWSIKSGAAAQAGAAAASGIAFLGPTAAMGIATTFGTASTGVAISSLSGAAATSAATAWLGGGALAAGGGGMAAGSAVLSFLAGPAGWILAGTGIVASTAIASKGNEDVAAKAEAHTEQVIVETTKAQVAERKACLLGQEIEGLQDVIDAAVDELKTAAPADYTDFERPQKEQLLALVNAARSLSAKINEAIK